MKNLLLLLLPIMLLGCQSSPSDLVRVWPTEKSGVVSKKYGPAISEAQTLKDFLLTPADISEMCSPRKYQIVIYADALNYYVAKANASPLEAKQYGECVNGKTGEITHPQERNLNSLLYISSYKESSQQSAGGDGIPPPQP